MLQIAHLEAVNLSLQTLYILLTLNQLLVHLRYLTRMTTSSLQQDLLKIGQNTDM